MANAVRIAEQMFFEWLEQYQDPQNLYPLIELQLKKLFDHFNSDSISNDKKLLSQSILLQNQIKQLKIRFGLNQVDKEIFELTMEHLTSKMLEIDKEMHNGHEKTSNLEKIDFSVVKKTHQTQCRMGFRRS